MMSSSYEVTLAFCKRAAIAQQLVGLQNLHAGSILIGKPGQLPHGDFL